MFVKTVVPFAVFSLALTVSAAPDGARQQAGGAAAAQAPPATRGRGAAPQPPGQGRGRGRATFPAQQRPLADPAVIERGRGIYSATCTACHGGDLRGGQLGGPNLLRSPVVLADDIVGGLAPILKGARAERGMPPIEMSAEDTAAVGAYLHSVVATMRGQGSPPPGPAVELNVVVGDPKAGAAFFAARCASCHSAHGDLKGIASRVPEPRALQNLWVAGSGRGSTPTPRRTVTAAITEPSGQRTEGRLVRYDDFTVTVALSDGTIRTFRRTGDVPKLEINDPLAAHRSLLPQYTNKDMHDVTAYLVTLK
jgi:cytochrome c oxidase cbb3-type subunit 3